MSSDVSYGSCGELMKSTVTLSEIKDFSGFEHCWKHLAQCKLTKSNRIYNKGLVGFHYLNV